MSPQNKKHKTPTPAALELDPALIDTAPRAFAELRAEIEAVPSSKLIRIYVDIPRAARCGLVAAENVALLLPELAELSQLDFRPIRMLGLYSLALFHAHDLASEDGGELPPLSVLVAEAAPIRESLLRTAELLAHYGLMPIERLTAIRRSRGYANLANDLLTLGRMFGELWAHVHDKVVATREEVDRAVVLSAQLQKALAAQEAVKSPRNKRKGHRLVRSQAFTLFCRAYEETRRGVTFLRWHEGDARSIVPSLRPRPLRRPSAEELEDAIDALREPSTMNREPASEPESPSKKAAHDLVANA